MAVPPPPAPAPKRPVPSQHPCHPDDLATIQKLDPHTQILASVLHAKLLSRVPQSRVHAVRGAIANLFHKAQHSSVAEQSDADAKQQKPSAVLTELRSKNLWAVINAVQDHLVASSEKAKLTTVSKLQQDAALKEAASADFLKRLGQQLNIVLPSNDKMESQGRAAMSQLRDGYAGKAYSVASRPLGNAAPPMDADAVLKLREMHPPLNTEEDLPPLPHDAPRVDISWEEVRDTIAAVNKGACPDPHGWFGALAALFQYRKKELVSLAAILTDVANADLPPDVKNALLTGRLAAIIKSFDELQAGIFTNVKHRPICSGAFLMKLTALALMRRTAAAACELLSPIQRGVGVASGCESAIHSIQLMLEQNPAWIAAKTDFINAFNTAKRSLVLKAIFAQPSLKHIWRFVHMCYSQPSLLFLFVNGDLLSTLLSSEGLRQGDVLGSLLFCIAVRQFYIDAVRKSGAQGVAICDDLTIVGPPEQVVLAFQFIVEHSKADTGLQVSVPKCAVFLPRLGQQNPAYFAALKAQHPTFTVQVGGVMPLVGSCIGLDDDARRAFVTEKVESAIALLPNLLHPSISIQAAVIFLRTSVFTQLNYLLRSLPPAVTIPGATKFREAAIGTLFDKMRISRGDAAATIVANQLFLPSALGGFGLADPVKIAPAAYLASIIACSPLFVTTSFDPATDTIVTTSIVPQLLETYRQNSISIVPPTAALNPAAPLSLCLEHVQRALATLTQQRALPLKSGAGKPVIPSTVHQLFLCFPDGQPAGVKLQHIITQQIHLEQRADLETMLTAPFDKARLKAASELASGLWCTTLPTSPGRELNDIDYRVAFCLRLGLHPDARIKDSPVAVPCPNHVRPGAPKTCATVDLRHDAFHCLGCMTEAKHGRFLQHNAVANRIKRLCEFCSATCQSEPAGYTSVNAHGVPTDQQRPDLLIITVAGNILADVVGYHPTCKSALANSSYDSLRAKVKIRKYENAAVHHRFSFTPFVFQTIGGLAPDAVALIESILRNNSSNIPYNILKYQALSEMSVAIQRENGNMFWRTLVNHFSN